MVVGQNTRRSHVELKRSQIWILLYLLNELVSESSRVRFPIDGNLSSRLVVTCDAHVRRRKTFKKMQQDFDGIIVGVNRGCERFPSCVCRAYELSPRGVVRYTSVKKAYFKAQDTQLREQE